MEDFWMEHRYCDKKFTLTTHYENVYQIVIILCGRVRYQVGEKEYIVSKGGIVVLNTLEYHTLEVLEYPYERYIIQVCPDFFQNEVKFPEIIAIFMKRPESFSHLLTVSQPVWNYIYEIVKEMEQEYNGKKKYWDIFVGADLRKMFIMLFRECETVLASVRTGRGAFVAYHVMNYLNHHYMEQMSLDDIAESMFMNKDYIARLFKQETGYSLMGYVILLRINHAKLLLTETEKSITDIALECGYTDFTYFSKQFKQMTGANPSKFRKENKKIYN